MTIKPTLIQKTENFIQQKTGKTLSFIQKIVLQESLNETPKTYVQIARENHYSEKYIRQHVAPNLWKLISEVFGEKVNRTNCRAVLEQKIPNASIPKNQHLSTGLAKLPSESPEGQVPLNSPLYIERHNLEQTCYQEILKKAALIRIKAPCKMGKTSLLSRILAYGKTQNWATVRLSLNQVETSRLASTNQFLRWLCANVTQQLGLDSKLNEYWDEDVGTLVSCTLYFQEHILNNLDSPLIFGLDEINQLFEHQSLSRDFLVLLRHWHEKGKDLAIWQKLRIILVHSTDIYIPIQANQSPFNIGVPIELPAFNQREVEELAQRHGLKLTPSELHQLMLLTGGYPYLVRLAFYHSLQHHLPVKELVSNPVVYQAIFKPHLCYLARKIKQNIDLMESFKSILLSPAFLKEEIMFELKSLGLIALDVNQVKVSCQLYQDYFTNYFNL